MAKITLYFPNQEAYDNYWQGNAPGSKFLCVIQNSGIEGVENVLVTASNNAPDSDGQTAEMGASTIDIIAAQQEEIETQYAIIDDYEQGDTVSKTEYNAVVDEINTANEKATAIIHH